MHAPGPSEIPLIDAAPFTHDVLVESARADGFLALPASAGAAAVFDASGRAVLLAATGDVRAWARRKLGATDESVMRPAADLRGIAASVRCVQCGSMLEADLAYHALARRHAPAAARLAGEQSRSWWACIDPGADFPEWGKSNLLEGAVAPRSASTARGALGGEVLGPFTDKDAAGRFTELVTDAFDLCRERRLLVLAPHAQACPYKEMGRCAAPCDGSETMDSYRARVREAVEACAGGARAECESADLAMRQAAAAGEFEEAARLKARAERFSRLGSGAFSRVGRLADFRFVLVWRSAREGWVRVGGCRGGHVVLMGDAQHRVVRRTACDGEGLAILAARSRAWAMSRVVGTPGREEVDAMGVLAKELAAPATRRTAWFVPVNPRESGDVWMGAVVLAATECQKPRKKAAPMESAGGRGVPATDHEIEVIAE